MTPEQTIRPGRLWYGVAIAVFLIGVVLAGALGYRFVTGLLDLTDDLTQVVVPGTKPITLDDDGDYTIFYEYESVVDGRTYQTGQTTPDLNVTLVSQETSEQVPISRPGSSVTYSVGDRSGESYLAFSIDRPGIYELSASYPSGRNGPEVVLAVGQGVGRGIVESVGSFFGAGAAFCGATILAGAIALITLIMRHRATQRQQAPL